MDINEVWEDLLRQLKADDSISASQIDAFFSRIQIQAVSPGFAMFTAANSFIKEWVQNHFSREIKDALKTLYGQDFEVMFEVDETIAPQPQPVSTLQPQPVIKEVMEPTPVKEEINKTADSPAQTQEKNGDSFNSGLTFETFVQGDSNRMAYFMAVEVAEQPGKVEGSNPLYIYGRSGVGKTHLLCAIKNYINQQYPDLNVCYIDSIEMVNRFVEASRTSSTDENSYNKFNDFFLDADVLLIDDIQRLRDAGGTLGAFFRIFNNLMGSGKQIVMSSDRAPKNIGLDDRYISRFNSGITIDIQPPDFETKRSIARNFLAQLEEDKGFKTDISSEVIDYLADNSSDNVRELKSAVSRLFYENKNKPETDLSLQRVKELLSNHFLNNVGSKITVETVQGAVEDFYKISHADLVGKKRSRNIAHPRQVAIYLMRNLLGLTQKELGEIFNRDHSTIKHSYDLIDGQKEEDFNLREELEAIREKIRTQQF